MPEQLDFESIKTKIIVALFSDDFLMGRLVLKGGNAINIVYKMYNRASLDFDFSIEEDFTKEELQMVGTRIHNALEAEFKNNELVVFDYRFEPKPQNRQPQDTGFWGGYVAYFKLASFEDYQKYKNNPERMRKRALRIDKGGKQRVEIEISKYEYCEREEKELDDYIVYVYPPALLALEKLRSICQQTEEYMDIVKKPGLKGRARDFFDIYYLCTVFDINLTSDNNRDKLKKVFEAKQVPLTTLVKIEKYKANHAVTFPAVMDTVSMKSKIHPFDFYYDFVVNIANNLAERFGIE